MTLDGVVGFLSSGLLLTLACQILLAEFRRSRRRRGQARRAVAPAT